MNVFEIGTDIVSISRIKRITQRFGFSFLQRFLLPSEIFLAYKYRDSLFSNEYFTQFCKPPTHYKVSVLMQTFSMQDRESYDNFVDTQLQKLQDDFRITDFKIETLAGFWAMKEACVKAFGCGIGEILSFQDMCIYKDNKGKPHIALSEKSTQSLHYNKIAVSMSHDENIAFAVCFVS